MVQLNYNGLSLSSGIYVIFNSHNWRIYVGSAKEFKHRWKSHVSALVHGKHSNKFLQADYDKCKADLGHDDFLEFHVLQNMPGSAREQRLEIEEKWIKVHFDNGKQCYNLIDKAISREGFGLKNPEETTRRKSAAGKRLMSSPERRAQARENMVQGLCGRKSGMEGKKHTEATKRKMSESHKGQVPSLQCIAASIAKTKSEPSHWLGRIHTEETKKKMRDSCSRKRQIVAINLTTNESKYFSCIRQAYETLPVSKSSIEAVLAGNRESAKGFKFQYVEQV